ncbi:MAG: transposase [Ardenticatenaceae bacterium]
MPHKGLKSVKPERVVESVETWHEKAGDGNPIWQEASEQLAEELFDYAPTLPLAKKGETSGHGCVEEENGKLVALNSVDIEQPVPSTTPDPLIPLDSIEVIDPPKGPQQDLNDMEIVHEVDVDEETKAMIGTHLADLAKKVIEGLPHARGDSDARVGRTTSYTWFCGYLIGFVVDDAHQVITAVVLGAGNAKQAYLFSPAIEAHIDRVGIPKSVALDSAFDEYQVHIYIDDKEIEGNVTTRNHTKPKDGGYGTDRVTWKDGIPHCPADKPLQPIGNVRKNGQQRYQGAACNTCKEYSRCYPSGDGKPKNFAIKPAELRRGQENRQHNQTQGYKEAQRARFATEGRFGLAKNNHHADRVPYRSDDYNLIAALMIATMMNLRILAKHK